MNIGHSSQVAISRRRLRWLAVISVVWLAMLFVLVGWWAWVVHSQAERIVELQSLAGLNSAEAHAHWIRTQRMLMWEGSTYFILLAGVSGALAWLYWRDHRRTNALHAFLASVTHELKTPLTSIRLQAEALADTTKPNQLIERLLEDTSRLEGQVEKMLELARLEGGGALALQPLPIATWLQRYARTAPQQGGVEIEMAPEVINSPSLVVADPSALQIIFRNLIENTARHAQASVAHARVTLESQGREVSLTFADDGKGFDGDSGRLGSLFFRGSRSQGAGVGLYLIHSLMDLMGGRAEFNSGHGRGFEARLHFRRAEDGS